MAAAMVARVQTYHRPPPTNPPAGANVLSVMQRSRKRDALAGLVAAAVALGVAELLAAIVGVRSLIVAVADVVVDLTPGPVVKATIEALGTNDKPFLLATVTVVALALGALLGPVAARRPRSDIAAFSTFGAAGALAAMRDPLAAPLLAVLVAAAGAAAGLVTLRVLLRAAQPAATAEAGEPSADRLTLPGRGVADRRRFLTLAGTATGGAIASALTGRFVIGPGVDVEAQRQAIVFAPIEGRFTSTSTTGIEVAGLSPVITPNADFYRIDTALAIPRVDATTWKLRITGMVDRPFELTFPELLAMPQIEETITLACVSNGVGGDLVGNAVWRGVRLSDLLARAGVQTAATQIVGRSVDDFTVGFPTAVGLDGRPAMVAVGMNGEPLPRDHGFPARLVVPGLYGYVSATKWLTEIQLTRFESYDAYWIPRGWDKLAPILTQSRIDVPHRGQSVTAGRRAIAGVAWAGNRGIKAVEVRVTPRDGRGAAPAWVPARLGDELSGNSWRQWVVEWDATPGSYTIEVRATDGTGEVQTAVEQFPGPNGATGYHRVNATVTA